MNDGNGDKSKGIEALQTQYHIPLRLRNQLIRQFSIHKFELSIDEDDHKIFHVNRGRLELCPEEAFTDRTYCEKRLCPYVDLCDAIMKILGEKIEWYGDCTIYEEENRKEAEERLKAVIYFLERYTVPVEKKRLQEEMKGEDDG